MRVLCQEMLIASIAAALLLGGCSDRRHGSLMPSAGIAPGASLVGIMVATTRSPTEASGGYFTGERGNSLSFAYITVSIPPDNVRQIGEVNWPTSEPPDSSKEFSTQSVEQLSRADAFQRLDDRIKNSNNHNVLLFVHGYNVTFAEAVYRLAQIFHDSGFQGLPILFSWPSRGTSSAYDYDRESAAYSRDDLERILKALSKDGSVQEISILAHSMGNWLTLEALRQMAIRDGKVEEKIRNVMLATPDIDVDVARTQIKAMGTRHPAITVVRSGNKSWGNTDLNSIDLNIQSSREWASEARISFVDLSAISPDSLQYTKFAESLWWFEKVMATTASDMLRYGRDVIAAIWLFLKDPTNWAVITGLAGGAWAVFTFLISRKEKKSKDDIAINKKASTPEVNKKDEVVLEDSKEKADSVKSN